MDHFISVNDVADIDALVNKALEYKSFPLKHRSLGTSKRMALLFMNPSLRTRISSQIAASNLGLECIVLNINEDSYRLELEDGTIMNGSTVEHIRDAAPVLGSWFDIICIRSFPALQDRDQDYGEKMIHQLLKYAGVPIVSLESSTLHPLQSLADIITVKELHDWTRQPRIVLSWAPHVKALPQCVPNSFAQWINAWDRSEFIIAHPGGLELDRQFTAGATITHDQQAALENADFVYVKNWSAFDDYGRKYDGGNDWMLTSDHLKLTNNAKIMHCLPVRRNLELADEVLDSEYSIVTQQAANRVWAAQSVFSEILNRLS